MCNAFNGGFGNQISFDYLRDVVPPFVAREFTTASEGDLWRVSKISLNSFKRVNTAIKNINKVSLYERCFYSNYTSTVTDESH